MLYLVKSVPTNVNDVAGYSEIAPLIQSQLIVAYLVHFINISMRKYALSVACSSGKKMKRALLDNSYHHYHYVTSHALLFLNLQLLLLRVLLLVFHCLPILANHGNRNCQTPAALDMVDGSRKRLSAGQ